MGIEPGWVKKNESATGVKLNNIFLSSSNFRLQIQSILQITKQHASGETRIMNEGSNKKILTSNSGNLRTTLISIPILTNYFLSRPVLFSEYASYGGTEKRCFFNVVPFNNRIYLPGKRSISP
jgi:hypothetical protein